MRLALLMAPAPREGKLDAPAFAQRAPDAEIESERFPTSRKRLQRGQPRVVVDVGSAKSGELANQRSADIRGLSSRR